MSDFSSFLPCEKDYDDLLFSLVGLNTDFSEWVKIGLMDEAERLDRHWASWTNFTQARVFCIHALRLLLIFFLSLDRMCAGPSTLEEISVLQNQLAQKRDPCFTSILSSIKWNGVMLHRKFRHNPTT